LTKKLTLLGLVLALLVAGVIVFVAGGRRGVARERVETPIAAAEEQPPLAPLIDAGTQQESATAVTAEARTPVASSDVERTAPRGELAGLTGRVVESDGTPVADIPVSLVEFESSLIFDGSAIGEEEPNLELEETRTNAEGRFRLGDANVSGFHGLGIDLGGARATIRVVDHALVPGEHTDVGDVVLAPYGVITGRVVDEAGAPVPGARVRFGAFPEQILKASPQEFRSDSAVAVSMLALGGEGQGIIELPPWIGRLVDRLPVPTTESGADGTFRLAVPLTDVIGGVDKRGYVGVPLGPFEMESGSYDAPNIVLRRGRTIRGRVEDFSGDPAVGVEVMAGAELYPGTAAILQPCGPTDAEGRFELTGVPDEGQIIATARRAPHEPWATSASARPDGVLIEIESTVQLTVNVHDAEGKPLSGADVRVVPGHKKSQNPAMGFVNLIPRPTPRVTGFAETEPGRYVNASLGAGLYEVTARVPGLAPATTEIDCRSDESEVTLTVQAGRRIDVAVVDAATKEPIANAHASALATGARGFRKLAIATTDASGHAQLGPLADLSDEPPVEYLPNEQVLYVQHARYGDHSATLDPDETSLVVELHAGGALAGRVHCGGVKPTRLYMLTVSFRGADGFLEFFHLPRFAVTDLEGAFRLTNLGPGEYHVSLSERFLQDDPVGLMVDEFDPPTLWSGDAAIHDGETTELDIDLTPTGRGALARVVGHVRYDGHNFEGARVSVRGNENVDVVSDASGRFETAPFSVNGMTYIQIEGDLSLADGEKRTLQLHSESVQLAQDDVHEIELDLYPLKLHAQVVADATGEPVPDASVWVSPQGDSDGGRETAMTDGSGNVELYVLQAGDYALGVNAAGYGQCSSSVKVAAEGDSGTHVLRLSRAVPCAGRVVRETPTEDDQSGFGYLWVHDMGSVSTGAMLEQPDHTFRVEGLSPGKYKGQIYMRGEQSREVEFELGPDGDENLVLYFEPAGD